jgi:starvation-inducible DNA-binding protein
MQQADVMERLQARRFITLAFFVYFLTLLDSETNGMNMQTTTPDSLEKLTMYETENDLALSKRLELIALMNIRLGCAIDLQMQMKQAHWNVKGPSFIALHELFDKVAEDVESYVDLIAERIVQLGGVAEGTVRMSAAVTRLMEYPLDTASGMAHVEVVARALSTFGQSARVTIDEMGELEDAVSVDMFTEISRGIDKWLWFVEAHSQASK